MAPALNFQQLILRLHQFWADKGCLIWQPYSEKVGAGTMNPATVISVLGPEPWNVAYNEPSYRPDDGRFGENPNRMQRHTQYQVILKPDPGNPQEIYLESLRAIGINTEEHDIRFVEDNWESPALGAWGLGWEVWLNGLEITQFTYFQQAGSHVLDMPAVEITYGLERIAIFLQGVRQVWDLRWDNNHTYGEILLQEEIDHCHYDFEIANVERLASLYQVYEDEARGCIEHGLVVPAHDNVLRCSHTFNVLDARGAIGVTERAAYFAKMRDLSKQIAVLYLKQREEKGFPLLAKLPPLVEPQLPALTAIDGQEADFLLEIGVEELPPDELQGALEQLRQAVPSLLKELRLAHASLSVHGTPRRLAVQIAALAARQPDREVEVKGPPSNRAYDAAGQPTPTLLGFCKSQGIDADSLEVRTEGNKSYVLARKHEAGQSAAAVLGPALTKLVSGIKFRKSMRWDRSGVAFSRPLRWLLCLHGATVVPFAFGHVVSGRTTRGPRPLDSAARDLATASDYAGVLKEFGVILDQGERRGAILEQIQRLAAEVGGEIELDEGLLEEVTHLVEVPVGVLGSFEAERLTLPAPVLTTVMKKHQRYFPVRKADGSGLLPHFVAISNGQRGDMHFVRQGNEDVLRARYADASYFVRGDQKQSLEEYLPRLATLTFQEKLGSMADKGARMVLMCQSLVPALNLDLGQKDLALRAAHLAKADLVTSMVVEMTSLQGVLGELYALAAGENPLVAQAIREHYLPRYAGDACPTSQLGQVVGLADRLDSLAGLFSIGLKPTGSADPYGLRRTALGLVALLVEARLHVDLRQLVARALSVQPCTPAPAAAKEILQFVADRLIVWLKDKGFRHDVVEAVVAEQSHDPYGAFVAVGQLAQGVAQEDWLTILHAYSRCKRITKDLNEILPLAASLLQEPGESQLVAAVSGLGDISDIASLLVELRLLQPKIDLFFDKVLVNAEDAELRRARHSLVQRIASLTAGLADFSKLEGF